MRAALDTGRTRESRLNTSLVGRQRRRHAAPRREGRGHRIALDAIAEIARISALPEVKPFSQPAALTLGCIARSHQFGGAGSLQGSTAELLVARLVCVDLPLSVHMAACRRPVQRPDCQGGPENRVLPSPRGLGPGVVSAEDIS